MNTNEAVQTMLSAFKKNPQPCLFCAKVNPALIGMTNFTGEEAKFIADQGGGELGKDKLAGYCVCADCASKYESEMLMSQAADTELRRQMGFGPLETKH